MGGIAGTEVNFDLDVVIKGDATLDRAIKYFEKDFKAASGYSWNDRNKQPKKHRYTYLRQNYQGMDLMQWPAKTITENAALVDRSSHWKQQYLVK